MKIAFLSFIFIFSLSLFSQTMREKQMVKEINLVRTNPTGYIKYIQDYAAFFEQSFGMNNQMKKDLTELVNLLKTMKPVKALVFSSELYSTAQRSANRIHKSNKMVHTQADVAENIVAGFTEPRLAVIDLLVDNGIKDRGHRENILDANFTEVAVAETTVREYGVLFIQQFK